jgi:hypothetical protein
MLKDFVAKTALVLLSVFFTFVAIDLVIYMCPSNLLPGRLRDLAFVMEPEIHYVNNPSTGFMIRPGSDYIFPGEEFTFRVQTRLNYSNAGFRGGTLGGPVWGAAFGDSFTFGAGVDQEATWVARLARLAQREVINFGVPGHGPPQYTRILDEYGVPFHPKIIFYGIFSNDLKDEVRSETPPARGPEKMTVKKFMRRYSATYNILRNLSRALKRSWATDTPSRIGVKLLDRRLRDPYGIPDEKFASVWAASARRIDEAIAESKRINSTFVLLYFPQKEEVYWELAKERIKDMDTFKERISRLRNSILSFCASRKALCLDLTPALKKHALGGEQLYYPVDIHWNQKGNALVAQEIYQFLLDKQLVTKLASEQKPREQ